MKNRFIGTLLVLTNLFQSHVRMDHEVRILGLGFGIFALSILFTNLAEIHLLPGIFSQQLPAFFICLCLLIYVAIHRNTAYENNLLMVKRDLDTAHNIPAALIASMVKIAFLSQLSNADRPEALLHGMNNTLTGQLDNEFITVIYLYIDLETRKITYSIAGHPAPIVLSRRKNTDGFLSTGSIPMGIRHDVTFPSRNMDLAAGDRIILYTDGLTESAGHRGELFGTARLSNLLRESLELPVEQAADRILSAVMKWTGRKKGAGLDDDLTFILFDAG